MNNVPYTTPIRLPRDGVVDALRIAETAWLILTREGVVALLRAVSRRLSGAIAGSSTRA